MQYRTYQPFTLSLTEELRVQGILLRELISCELDLCPPRCWPGDYTHCPSASPPRAGFECNGDVTPVVPPVRVVRTALPAGNLRKKCEPESLQT
jgi:hypothetical protein